MEMELDYDPAKNARNLQRRGLSFELIQGFDWETATVEEDAREHYGEQRWKAAGFINEKLYLVVLTWRGRTARIISLRQATKYEEKRYVQQTRP